MARQFESSARDLQRAGNENSMKKAKPEVDELRSEYKRSDFGKFVRGKYARRAASATNVVLLEPAIAKAFPNDRAVNDALRLLLDVRDATSRLGRNATGVARRRRSDPTGHAG
jgi:hypothetical protein